MNNQQMMLLVARALGEDLLTQVVFVGGCTTSLLITDGITQQAIRYTDDVDLIINLLGYCGWADFVERLKPRGFTVRLGEEITCRLHLGNLKVDFMPIEDSVLMPANRWYKSGYANAINHKLSDDTCIKILTAPYFIATKIEAFKNRGGNDLLGSQDAEDIFNVIDGREELLDEILQSTENLQHYIAQEFKKLYSHIDIERVIQSAASGDKGRQNLIFDRIEAIIGGKKL